MSDTKWFLLIAAVMIVFGWAYAAFQTPDPAAGGCVDCADFGPGPY